jgi:hypothetical protein
MNTKSKSMKAIRLALILALTSSAGSAHAWTMPKIFRLDNTWPFRDKDKPQEGIPVRMVGAWTDTVMSQPGQKSQRGFGGRLMFYDKDGKKPILVDGQLVVYAFDEAGRDPTDNKPTRRYVFPADQMPVHMSKSEIGASYSFWLPWDEAGGPKCEVSLMCRFEPKGGAVVTGEQTKHLLAGPPMSPVATSGARTPPTVPEGVPSKPPRLTLEDIQAKRNAEQQAQLTSFEVPLAGGQGAVANLALQTGASPERRLTAATIPLPQNYQLPDTAALNAAMQSAAYQQSVRQMAPNPAQVQQPAAPAMYQPAGAAPAYIGSQIPQQHLPPSAPPMYPGVQAVAQSPVGSNPAFGQIQQQSYQQPMPQPPIRQPQQTLPAWPQAMNQAGPAPTVNSPAQVQYR